MNSDNKRILWQLIQQTGDSLIGKLSDHPHHPRGRNPYAHVASRVKSHFQQSYKDLPDARFDEVIQYLEIIKKEKN